MMCMYLGDQAFGLFKDFALLKKPSKKTCWHSMNVTASIQLPVTPIKVILKEVDGTLFCPACGQTMFSYMEKVSHYWPFLSQEQDNHVVLVDGMYETFEDGNGNPGLFCDNLNGNGCGRRVAVPLGWEIEWD